MARVGVTGVTKVSGQPVKISGETVTLSGLDYATQSGQQVITTVAISGTNVRIGSMSGDFWAISGSAVKVSGEVVSLPDTQVVKVSGEVVSLPDTQVVKISGEAVKISGEVVDIKVPTSIKTGLIRTVTAASGGVVLHSGAVLSVTIKALTGNSADIYVGGDAHPNMPYSGAGFQLAAGEAMNVDCDDFDAVYLFAAASGDQVTFLGVA